MKVALVHDWLTGMRGGEAVFKAITELYPEGEIFTLIHDPSEVDSHFSKYKIHTSHLQNIPGITEHYRKFLPLMPLAISRFDLSSFDLVISSSHCVAKGVKKRADAKHVSYVHAPMRYMWDRFDDYFGPGKSSPLIRAAALAARPSLRRWDVSVSGVDRIDCMIANSSFIQSKIKEFYHRDSSVIHPFMNWERFQELERAPGDFYLMVGALAPYKRVDLVIEAFGRSPERKLVIVGDGQDSYLMSSLPKNITWLGRLANSEISKLYSECKAFIFPGVEDFGITPLEAMASGVPVIALRKGGAVETVTSDTGVFFEEQTTDVLLGALIEFEKRPKDAFPIEKLKNHAKLFSVENFKSKFREAVNAC